MHQPNLKMSIRYLPGGKLDVNVSNNPKVIFTFKLRNLPIKRLNISNTGLIITLDLKQMPLNELIMRNSKVT